VHKVKMNVMVLGFDATLRKEPEGGFTISVPLLPGCVTYGETFEEAERMAEEAIALYVESLQVHGENIPSQYERNYEELS